MMRFRSLSLFYDKKLKKRSIWSLLCFNNDYGSLQMAGTDVVTKPKDGLEPDNDKDDVAHGNSSDDEDESLPNVEPEDRDSLSPTIASLIALFKEGAQIGKKMLTHLSDEKNQDPGYVHSDTMKLISQMRKLLSSIDEERASNKPLEIPQSETKGANLHWQAGDVPDEIRSIKDHSSKWHSDYFLSSAKESAACMGYNGGNPFTYRVPSHIAEKYGFPDGCFLHVRDMNGGPTSEEDDDDYS